MIDEIGLDKQFNDDNEQSKDLNEQQTINNETINESNIVKQQPNQTEQNDYNINLLGSESVKDIMAVNDSEELKNIIALFNVNQAKKNMLRIQKLNQIRDLIDDQTLKRLMTNPDTMSHKDLVSYMDIVQKQIDSNNKFVEQLDSKPLIQINNQYNENNININNDVSVDKIKDAIKQLLDTIDSNTTNNQVIDVETHDLNDDSDDDETIKNIGINDVVNYGSQEQNEHDDVNEDKTND